mmetsp:Transcript_14217/g.25471  ORF Transcript_14217/g.25471 Transcript_14217/m.25471 type:complete len:215 (+) Transcript_14217:46-690(+)
MHLLSCMYRMAVKCANKTLSAVACERGSTHRHSQSQKRARRCHGSAKAQHLFALGMVRRAHQTVDWIFPPYQLPLVWERSLHCLLVHSRHCWKTDVFSLAALEARQTFSVCAFDLGYPELSFSAPELVSCCRHCHLMHHPQRTTPRHHYRHRYSAFYDSSISYEPFFSCQRVSFEVASLLDLRRLLRCSPCHHHGVSASPLSSGNLERNLLHCH